MKKALPMLADNGKQWTLNLLKKADTDNDALTGENQQAHLAYEQYGQSVSGPITEATSQLPTGVDENGVKLTWQPATMTRTIGLSWARLEKLRRLDSSNRVLGIAKLTNDAFTMERAKRQAMFEGGRGDNIGARAFEAGSGTTFKCTPGVPILFQRGDAVLAYSSDEAGGERLRDAAASGTFGSTAARVIRVSRDAQTPSITLSAGDTWGINTTLAWSHGATLRSVHGLPFMLDSVGDGTFKWDADDGTSAAHFDPNTGLVGGYFGGTRSSNPDLDCQILNAQTEEIDIKHFSQAMGYCIDGNNGDASVCDELAVGMSMRMWRRFVHSTQGAVRITTSELFLPGNTKSAQKVPIMTGKGVKDMPIMISAYIPDGFVMFIHYTKLRKIFSDPGFIPGNDGIWHILPQASVAGHQAEFQAYMIYQQQNGMFLPNSSCVAWNFDTSEDL
jgi:hypothetical protein